MQLPHDLLEVSTPPEERLPACDKKDPNIVMSLRRDEAERVLAQLTRVEETLNRLDSNGFGRCARCGRDIEEVVLKKDLTTETCALCTGTDETDE